MKKNKAFTLLELSLVVAIIAILIAGITKGNDLIRSSTIASARAVTARSVVPNIDGLVAWYETSMLESLLPAETLDGAQISTWYDISPASIATRKNTLSRTASSAVTYKAQGINKLPSIYFGSGGIAASSFYQGPLSTATFFVVFRLNSAIASSVNLIDNGSTSTARAIGLTSTALTLNAGTGVSMTTSFNANRDYAISVYFNGSYSGGFSNDALNPLSFSLNPGSNSQSGITVGSDRNGSSSIVGLVSEVIVYNRSLIYSDRIEIMKYLSKKYGITVANI